MEFVQGRELKDYFEANERFAPPDIVRIMTQILDALGYSHKLGVIHRDIKPANVILLDDGGVKVADFGIAHIESSNMTQAGTVMGTPSYMSPEQIMGLPVDGRSDLFSAGVILYQFLTGERPFSGSATATMHKVLEEDPLPPSRFNVQVPGAMDAVVRKALAKRPDERYQNADEFAAALRAAAREAARDATPTRPRSPRPKRRSSRRRMRRARSGSRRAGRARRRASAPVDARLAAPAEKAADDGHRDRRRRRRRSRSAPSPGSLSQRSAERCAKVAQAPAAPTAPAPAPAPTSPAPRHRARAGAAPPKTDPGLGRPFPRRAWSIPAIPRYGADKSLLQSDLRADAKGQLVAKALGLMVDPEFAREELRRSCATSCSRRAATTYRRSSRRARLALGKDGLMSMTTQAVVNVRALQKSLNQMSRDERVDFIRASGDPKISVRIAVRDADQPNAPPQPSPVAENLLKERIKAFGFRTWSDDGNPADPKQFADFVVLGEVQIKKLSARLEASGVVITKYTLTSWTVKCIDRATGEEIYFNTTLPKGVGSWAERRRGDEARSARRSPTSSRATSSCSTSP